MPTSQAAVPNPHWKEDVEHCEKQYQKYLSSQPCHPMWQHFIPKLVYENGDTLSFAEKDPTREAVFAKLECRHCKRHLSVSNPTRTFNDHTRGSFGCQGYKKWLEENGQEPTAKRKYQKSQQDLLNLTGDEAAMELTEEDFHSGKAGLEKYKQLKQEAQQTALLQLPPSVKAIGPTDRRSSANMVASQEELTRTVRQLIPPLSGQSYKGQHGKVGVLGGCRQYTGAPYFAAISAAKTGADMTFVFCTAAAAPVIKSYSPELIVLPSVPDSSDYPEDLTEQGTAKLVAQAARHLHPWLMRLNCLVVGPGLGDDPLVVGTTKELIRRARAAGVQLLIDGSGLNVVASEPELVRGYPRCVLTPNIAELGRLAVARGLELNGPISTAWQQHAAAIAQAYEGPVLLSKGPKDVITDGQTTIECDAPSSLKRSGGQGDVVAGCVSTFICWSELFQKERDLDVRAATQQLMLPPLMLAAWGGSLLTRTASAAAFAELDRSMLAGDVIHHLHRAFRKLFA